jgi:transcriptional regulator with XRE-family HTH domain
MAMTNAQAYGSGKALPEFIFYQMLRQTISTTGLVLEPSPEPPVSEQKKTIPILPRDQLLLIIGFFGFSNTEISRICGVSRPTVYAWIDGKEPKTENLNKIKNLAQIAFDIAPEPACPLFHHYSEEPIQGYEKSLVDYLIEDTQDRDFIVRLASTIYQMSKERRERIAAIPKAKYGDDPSILEYNLDSFEFDQLWRK